MGAIRSSSARCFLWVPITLWFNGQIKHYWLSFFAVVQKNNNKKWTWCRGMWTPRNQVHMICLTKVILISTHKICFPRETIIINQKSELQIRQVRFCSLSIHFIFSKKYPFFYLLPYKNMTFRILIWSASLRYVSSIPTIHVFMQT